MSEKKITFLAALDDTQINQAIAGITLKMKALQSTASMPQITNMNNMAGPGGHPSMSANTQNAMSQAYSNNMASAKREYAEQMIQLNKIGESYTNINKALSEQIKLRQSLVAGTKEAKDLDEKILQTTKEQIEAERALGAQSRMAAAAAAGIPKTPVTTATGGSGGGMNTDTIAKVAGSLTSGNVSGAVIAAGASAAIVGAIAGAIALAMKAFSTISYNPIQIASDRGSAVQSVYGKEIDARYQGRSGLEASYSVEKLKAMQDAKNNKASNETEASFSWNGLASPFSDSAMNARNADLAKKTGENYNTALEGYKNQNPLLRNAKEAYYANAQGDLNFQRQMGLDYNSFHGAGGYQDAIANAGFDPRQGMGMSSAILGAGGSTGSGGSANAILALQAQRNFGATNAASLLGKIGGNNGNEADNKESLIRIFAAGTKLGFDGSHFVEESRKFNDIVADIISKSGSGSTADAERNANRFASFVADPTTTKGIESAKNAYDAYQQTSSQTSGRGGVIRAAGFLSSQGLNKLNPTTRNVLFSLPEGMLTTTDPTVIQAAEEQGVTPQDILDSIRKDANIPSAIGGNRQLQKDVNARKNLLEHGDWSAKNRDATMKKFESLDRKVTTGLRFVDPNNMTGPQAVSFKSNVVGDKNYGPSNPNIGSNLTSTGDTGRMEDKNATIDAEAAKDMLKTFREYKDVLIPATAAMKLYNDQIERNAKLTAQGTGPLAPEYKYSIGTTQGMVERLSDLLSPNKDQQQAGVPGK